MMPQNSRGNTLICPECGLQDIRTGLAQTHCSDCAEKLLAEYKLKWQRKHDAKFGRQADKVLRLYQKKRRSAMQETGEKIGLANKKGLTGLPNRSSAVRSIRFEFPNDGYLSKNAIVNIGMRKNKGFAYVREDVKKRKNAIALLVMGQVGRVEWPKSKTWIDVMVQKHMVGTDAINIVDTVCDGIKEGLGVDDEWFCIGTLDWEVVKKDPKIFVQISTFDVEHQRVCGCCWQIRSYKEFGRHLQNPTGLMNHCLVCTNFKGKKKLRNEKQGLDV